MRHLKATIVLLAVAHVCLALAFAWITPWRTAGVLYGRYNPDIGAPDEYAHANYVRHILRGEGLPRLDPRRAAPEALYEDHQPPLFYLLDAGLGRALGATEVDSQAAKMPLRAFNALAGAATVVGTFFLVFWASNRPRIALAAAAFVALLPMNVALSGAVSNDPLLFALSTWVFALGARQLRRSPEFRVALLLGALAGLAIMTKFTGLLFLVLLPFFLRDRRQLFAAWAVAAVIAAPYLVRNEIVYGHPLAANAFNATFQRSVDLAELKTPHGFGQWAKQFSTLTVESFIGRFGYMDIGLPHLLAFPLIVLVGIGLLLGARLPSAPVRYRRAAGTFVALLALSFLSYNLWQLQPQARYLFPAIGLFAYACAEGYRRRGVPTAFLVLLGGLLVADGAALVTLPAHFADHTGNALGASSP